MGSPSAIWKSFIGNLVIIPMFGLATLELQMTYEVGTSVWLYHSGI